MHQRPQHKPGRRGSEWWRLLMLSGHLQDEAAENNCNMATRDRAKSRETSGFDSLLGSSPGEPVRRTCEGCKICTRRVRVSETRKEGGRKRGGGGERRRRGEEREERGRERRRAGAHSCSWLPPAGCVHSLDRYRLTHPRPPTPEARSCATLLGAVLPSDQGRQLALPLRRVVARVAAVGANKEGRG